MAKYTELLAEYLEEGGQLPALFDNIDGFKNLFIGTYADCEIGFETPALFALKLETRAQLVIPLYVERIAALEAVKTDLSNPTKVRTKTGAISRLYGATKDTRTSTDEGEKVTHNGGTVKQSNPDHVQEVIDQPFDNYSSIPGGSGATPSRITTDKAFDSDTTTQDTTTTESYNGYKHTDTDQRDQHTDTETYDEVKDTETGFTVGEAESLYKALESDIFNIKKELLNEFSNLFMQVY